MLSVVLLMFKSYFKVMPKHRNTLQLLILFLTCVHCFSQSRTITVKDAVTNEALPFASINLLNGFGLYTNEIGQVNLAQETPNKIQISYVGYLNKIIFIDQLTNDTVLLTPEENKLEEVEIIVSKKNRKVRKEYSVKPIIHDDINKMYWSAIGLQYAFFIPNSKENSRLHSITIPVITKDLHQGITETTFESDPYGTLVKIEFASVLDHLPHKKLYDYEKKVIIHAGRISEKTTIPIEETIPIPEEGLFVTMTIMGKTNKKDVFQTELPYAFMNLHDRKKKIIKIILPNYPLVKAPKGVDTYFRNVFSNEVKWERISRPMVFKDQQEYPIYNIGIGYTFTGY